MPYITKEERAALSMQTEAYTAGQLNYAITKWLIWFLGPAPRYEEFNAAIGVLECAKLELYRRMVVPYEDRKIKSNGDVYPS